MKQAITGVKALTFDTGGTILDWHGGLRVRRTLRPTRRMTSWWTIFRRLRISSAPDGALRSEPWHLEM